MDSRVEAVIEILDQNWQRSVRVPPLAREVGLSTVRLQHLFKRETGMSIRRYITERRLAHAATLLSSSDLRVKEVCHCVGFGDLRDFYRVFKERYGTGPAAFRKAAQTTAGIAIKRTAPANPLP